MQEYARISKNEVTAFCWSSSLWESNFLRSGCFIGSCPRGYIVTWLTREREREGGRGGRRKEEGRESEAYPSKGPEFTVLLSQSSAGQRAREGPLWRRAEVVHSKLLECVRLSEISSSSPLRLLGDTHRPRKGGHNAELYLYCDSTIQTLLHCLLIAHKWYVPAEQSVWLRSSLCLPDSAQQTSSGRLVT